MPDSSSPSGDDASAPPPAETSSATPTTPPAGGPAPAAALPVPKPQVVRWLIIGIAAIVAASLWSWRGKTGAQEAADAPLTLVTQ